MRETLVVFRRELRSFFLSPIAYVFGILLVSVLLYYVSEGALQNGARASAEGLFATLPLMLVLFLPGLTMRMWAEERKLGTLELLMTFPVRIGQLVFGKFLACVVYLACVLALTLGLPLTLGAYGKLDWSPVLGSYLASLLFAGSFVAVGMFWSSTTRDQMVAMLLSLVSLFVLYQLGNPQNVEYASDWMPAWLVDLVSGLSPHKYFVSIARGVLDSRDIVVSGDGTASVASFQAASLKEGQRLFHNSGSAPMGFDLPAAIGAAIATGRRIVCLAGDGSVQMNLQELQSIVTHRLPVAIFVLNNRGYHSIRQTQQNFFPDNVVGCGDESGLGFPDFSKLAWATRSACNANHRQRAGDAAVRKQ